MGLLSVAGHRRRLRRGRRNPERRRPCRERRRDRRHHRPERRRQIDAAEDHRRPAASGDAARSISTARRSTHCRRATIAPARRRLRAAGAQRLPDDVRAREPGDGRLYRSAATRRRIDAAFERFPMLAEKRRRAARTLVGGQRQMLAMAMALMVRADAAVARRALGRAVADRRRAAVRRPSSRSTARASPSPWSSRTPTRRWRSRIARQSLSTAATTAMVRRRACAPIRRSAASSCGARRRPNNHKGALMIRSHPPPRALPRQPPAVAAPAIVRAQAGSAATSACSRR